MSNAGAGPERLRVYALAQDLGAEVDAILRGLDRRDRICEQLRRAVDSVILNIAEGAGHYGPGRKVALYQIAHGSATECIAALTRLDRRRPTRATRAARRTANMICIMLTGLIRMQSDRRQA